MAFEEEAMEHRPSKGAGFRRGHRSAVQFALSVKNFYFTVIDCDLTIAFLADSKYFRHIEYLHVKNIAI